MAKEKENENQLSKLEQKKEKAVERKEELVKQIEELKKQILDENDEKAKAKLRKERDELIAQKDSIVITDEKVKIPMPSKTKKCLTACISIVVVIALLVCYVATGAAKHGFISTLGWPQKAFTGLVLTDNDGEKHSIKVSTYNYYFANYYNNLQQTQSYMSQLQGLTTDDDSSQADFETAFKKQTYTDDDGKKMTWAQHAEDEVIDNIKSVYSYYYAALSANKGKEPSIKDSQKEELDETLKDYKEQADKYGFTLDAYLTAALGYGVDESTFRREATVSYISQNYQEDYSDELSEKAYSEDDYKKYLDENREDLVSVDVKYFECSSEDDAEAFVKALKKDGSNFAQLASKYSEDDYEKKANKDPVETTYKYMTRTVFQNIGSAIGTADEHEETEDEEEHEHTYKGLDWLYSKDRKAGDKKNFSTSVVYVLKPVYLSDVKTVNVRHILLQLQEEADDSEEDSEPTQVSASEATDEQWKDAEKRAKEVLEKYNKGEKTEEAFAELAKSYSDDSNAEDGGLYENITPNQMVPTFNAWIFDSSRKPGDVSIVKTEYGYHLIYFVSEGDMEAWKYTAQQALAANDSEDTIKKFEDSIKIKKSWPGSCYFEVDTDISN